jgi:uncharacterized membrane protein
MSKLIAIGYPNQMAANDALNKLVDLQAQHLITLQDAVVVERRGDGKIKLHQTGPSAGTGAAGGALWGGLIGLLFFVPLLGMALGAGTGAMMGKVADTGVDDDFMRGLGDQLEPGRAALVLLVEDITEDKVLEQMHGQYGGQLLRSSLSKEEEDRLKMAAAAAAARAA